MTAIDTKAPSLVTGATGYVAGWIVKALLDAGATVHAAVRDPDNTARIAHLQRLAEAAPGTIRFFKSDLLEEGSYAEAMTGCSTVFHTASPFTSNFTDPEKDLVDPAVKGTRNVLQEACRQSSVTRVVVTSSMAAIYGDNIDCARAPGGVLTEDQWNTTSSLDHNAYSYSKVMAEREAWSIAKSQDRWKLVTVNPSFVLGPAFQDRPTSESFSVIKQMGDGTMRSGVPRIGFGIIDVRDLAEAHLKAAFLPEAEGRHIISAHNSDFLKMAQILHDHFGKDYPIPNKPMPKWLVWLIGPLVSRNLSRKYISRNVNVDWKADNSKSTEVLGMSYRPLETTMIDMFKFMIERGYFKS